MNDLRLNSSSHVANKSNLNIDKLTSVNTSGMNIPIEAKKKKNRVLLPTIRFDLKINKPSLEKFTEFNYNKLALKTFKCIKKLSKKSEHTTSISNSDLKIIDGEFRIEKKNAKDLLTTFRKKIILCKELDAEDGLEDPNEPDDREDDDDYSSNLSDSLPNAKKKGKKSKKSLYDFDLNKFKLQDFSYLGKGYDENDSFIDNSDAQDVHLPQNMVPKRGGFYINREKLKLKSVDEVKKSSKRNKEESDMEMDENNAENNGNEDSEEDTLEDSEDYSESDDEDSEDESEEEESENSDEESEKSEEENSGNEETEEENTIRLNKTNGPEIDLASSSSSCKIVEANANGKKSKKRVIVDDDNDQDENNGNDDLNNENNDLNKNKENNLTNSDQISINNTQSALNSIVNANKKRKNDTQTNELVQVQANSDKIQNRMVNGDIKEEIVTATFKKKKIEPTIEQSNKPSPIHNQILNEKNQRINNPNPSVLNSEKEILNKQSNPKEDSNDYIDVEEDNSDQNQNRTNLNNTSLINNSLNRSNLNQSISTNPNNNQLSTLPDNITNEFRLLINKVIELYHQKAIPNTENLPTDVKTLLTKVYIESKRLKTHSQIFNYISLKMNRSKDSLYRMCRRVLNKEVPGDQSVNSPKQEAVQVSNPEPQIVKPQLNQTKPQSNVNTSSSSLKLKQTSPSSPQITLNDLNEDIKSKLVHLKTEYQLAKQRAEASKFFEHAQVNQMLYSIDCYARSNRNPTRMREFFINFLSEAFQFNKEQFNRQYHTIVGKIRQRNTENSLKNRMIDLKKEIDAEMPKVYDKFNKHLEEYTKNKALLDSMNVQDPELRKKLNPPRKRFDFTDKIRELLAQIINLKMSLYKSSNPQSPQQNEASLKLAYIENFFDTELVNLWPKNWMQKNVLVNFYQIRYCQQQQHQRVTNSSNVVNKMSSAPTTPVSTSQSLNKQQVINISSKNGKPIKIEQAMSTQTSNQTFTSSTPLSTKPVLSQVIQTKTNLNTSQIVSKSPAQQLTPQQQQQLLASKQNVYDQVVNQHKKKPTPTTNPSTSLNNSIKIEELFQTPSNSTQLNKSPHNLYQISNLIQSSTSNNHSPQADLAKLQQFQQMLMLPGLNNLASQFIMHSPQHQPAHQPNHHSNSTTSK